MKNDPLRCERNCVRNCEEHSSLLRIILQYCVNNWEDHSSLFDMVRTKSVKEISRTFQGFSKAKLQFSRTKIYSKNQHSLSPFWTPYWLKNIMESFIILTSSATVVDHIINILVLLPATALCKMTRYDLQLHLRYRNSIWNRKETRQQQQQQQ